MKLSFKNWSGWGYTEKEVPVLLNIGTLEAVCKALKIEFWQIAEEVKTSNSNFTTELLYQGYLQAYTDIFLRASKFERMFIKKQYTRKQAVIWNEYMSRESQKEFMNLMTNLFGEITKLSKSEAKKKVTKESHSANSGISLLGR